MPPDSDNTGQQDRISNSAAHLDPWVWEHVGDLRDHLAGEHRRRAEMLVGLNRFALMDFHKELHDGIWP